MTKIPTFTVTVVEMRESPDFKKRVASVMKILETLKLCDKHSYSGSMTGDAEIIASFRDFEKQLPLNKNLLNKIKKIQTNLKIFFKEGLIYDPALNLEMLRALEYVAFGEIFEKYAIPKVGRPEKQAAFELAFHFAKICSYTLGWKLGVNPDSNFVLALDEIFKALEFKANAQHVAGKAVAAFRKELAETARHQEKLSTEII